MYTKERLGEYICELIQTEGTDVTIKELAEILDVPIHQVFLTIKELKIDYQFKAAQKEKVEA